MICDVCCVMCVGVLRDVMCDDTCAACDCSADVRVLRVLCEVLLMCDPVAAGVVMCVLRRVWSVQLNGEGCSARNKHQPCQHTATQISPGVDTTRDETWTWMGPGMTCHDMCVLTRSTPRLAVRTKHTDKTTTTTP